MIKITSSICMCDTTSYPTCTIFNTFTGLEEMQTINRYLHLHYFNYCIQLGWLLIPHCQPVLYLLCAAICYYDVWEYLSEEGMVSWLCASLTEIKCQPFDQSHNAFLSIQFIICKTDIYMLTNWTRALDVYSVLIPTDIVSLSPIGRLKLWTMNWPHTGCRLMLVYRKRQRNYTKIEQTSDFN